MLLAAACLPVAAQAGTMILGAYPNALILFDESKGTLIQRVPLETGLPTGMRLSNDNKRIYVSTITTGGIEVFDIATRKIINHFSLNTPTTKYRFGGGVPDPTGRYFYTIGMKIDKEIDRYAVSDPQYMVIDLQLKKVVRSAAIAKEDDGPGAGRGSFMMSPDGKSLYVFREKVIIVDTATLKAVDRFDLAKPEGTGLEGVNFGGGVEAIRSSTEYVSLFTAADPYVHNKVFGVGRFDLVARHFTFVPIGPAPQAIAGLEVTPDRKEGYTVVTNNTFGNKRCEFLRFDMATNKVLNRSEFPCRTRFSFGMSNDGNKLYIYGASFDVEVYDAKTLQHEKTWDLGNDATGAGLVVLD
jgi:DNA-binding beta-propeller fold protein YncE